MPLAKSYTRQAEEILDTGKKDVKKIRQAGKFADNEIRDRHHLDLSLEGSLWLAAVNRSGRAHRGRNKAISIIFMQASTTKPSANDQGGYARPHHWMRIRTKWVYCLSAHASSES